MEHNLNPGTCIINIFTAVINPAVQQATDFAIVSHFVLALTNTLSFYVTELITPVINFMIKTPSVFAIKHYGFVIYGKWTDSVVCKCFLAP